MNAARRIALAALLLVAGRLSAQSASPQAAPATSLESLAAQVREVLDEHRAVYLGPRKTPEQASKLPATLWHIGEPVTVPGDLNHTFQPASSLGHQRDAARLDALARRVSDLRPQAEDLGGRAHAASSAAAEFAATVLSRKRPTDAIGEPPKMAPALSTESDPGWLIARARAALAPGGAGSATAAAYLREAAARLEHLADLDRWLALNCRWLVETNQWTRSPGMAPRSLCYSIEARFNEAAAIQSRVEDVLFATEGERAVWPWAVARAADAASAPAARPGGLVAALPELRKQIAELREADVKLDRELAALTHERKFREVFPRRQKEYAPLVVKLEYLQREAALARWAGDGRPGDLLVADTDARPLSLSARAALAHVASALTPQARKRLKPVLTTLLAREYLASYADLCLYQSAVLATEPHLAVRLQRWLDLTRSPHVRGLVDMLHPTPGVMTTAQRSDNAYQGQLMAWADQCRGKDRAARFKQARELTHVFYRKSGYNQNKPVYTMRDILESGLVDCLAGCRIQGAVAAAAGVEGIVPVRYWRDTLGHTLIGLRTAKGIIVVDPLGGPTERRYPGGYPNVTTVETGAPSFGSYVVDDIEIVATGKRLRRRIPYLEAEESPKR